MPFEQSKLQALINGGIWSNGKKSIVYKIGGEFEQLSGGT
jgi:hypothetical protein